MRAGVPRGRGVLDARHARQLGQRAHATRAATEIESVCQTRSVTADEQTEDPTMRGDLGSDLEGIDVDLLARLEAVHADAQMVGWDFSRLDGALVSDSPWWDFETDCLHALRDSRVGAVDLGTGGCERLSALLDSLAQGSSRPPQVTATEGWSPNVPEARARLTPRDVRVLQYDSEAGDPLDLPDRSQDVVMSRHESYDPAEVARVLVSGGRFLTQQVDGFDAPEIHEWFGGEYLHSDVTVDAQAEALRDAGMRIDQVDHWEGTMRFRDAVALVTYIGLVPWDAPGFAVRSHARRLSDLQAAAPITVTQRRFRIYATTL